MEDKISKLLQELIAKVYQINKNTKHDVFLRFSGHVNNFDVEYYKNGFEENDESTYLAFCEYVTEENIERVIKELEKLETEEE